MRNFLMGMIKGVVVAGLGLGAASYLLPARVGAPVAQVEGASSATDAAATPAPDMAAAPAAEAKPDPAASAAAEPTAAPDPAPAPEPAAAPAAEPADEPAKNEALLDPAPAPAAAAEPAPAAAAEPAATDAAPAADQGASAVAKMESPPKAGDKPALPTIGANDAAAATPAPAVPSGGKPLQAYAAAFAGAQGKPLFSIVIMDTGAPDLDRAVWASLPLPLSFAVDPESPKAAEAMALYRAAGKEVIMLPTTLPKGGQAGDVETSFATYEKLLPESVAVMSDPVAGFQDDRALAGLVVPSVGAQGRGVLLFDKGLNSAAQIAQREGIPYAMISKMIDAGGESVPVMRRYLDRAVFKAAQDGAAVVMGQTLPDTLAALNEWALEGKAADVTLAPISALMTPAK